MKELICIICPRGCRLQVDDNLVVTGNTCPRGEAYAKAELTHPVRFVTSTVAINGAFEARLPVKTSKAVSKELIFPIMDEIRKVNIDAPVHIGDVIIPNILGSGADLVATKNIERFVPWIK